MLSLLPKLWLKVDPISPVGTHGAQKEANAFIDLGRADRRLRAALVFRQIPTRPQVHRPVRAGFEFPTETATGPSEPLVIHPSSETVDHEVSRPCSASWSS